MTFIQ